MIDRGQKWSNPLVPDCDSKYTNTQDVTKCHFDSKAKSALFIYIHVGYIHCILYKTGEYMQFEYIQVLDIFCQQLGDMYQLEGVRAPFSCRVYQLIEKGLML